MKDQVLCVDYWVIQVDDRPGTGSDLMKKLAKEGVNLLSVMAFPSESGKTQVDIVPENPDLFTKAIRKIGLTARGPKMAFLIQGTDKPGAIGEILDRLSQKNINVKSTCGIGAGSNRFAAILWVAPADVDAATRALGAQVAAHHHV